MGEIDQRSFHVDEKKPKNNQCIWAKSEMEWKKAIFIKNGFYDEYGQLMYGIELWTNFYS